jgi:uridine phosphorylase
MPFPNYENKHMLEAVLNPIDIVEYRRRLGRLPKIGQPAGILFCLDRSTPHRMRRRIPIQKAGGMLGDLYLVKKPKNRVGVIINVGGGSPIIAELSEEFAALGIKRLALMTWAGALQPDLKAGDIVVCDQAIRDDGTSYHYLPPGKSISADGELVEKMVEAIKKQGGSCSVGATWTTDAPYRETREEIQRYQSEGVKTVEMESAGLFTIGKVRHIQTVSVVVIMDSLATLKWKVPERLDAILKSLEIVYAATIDVLGQP